MVSRTLLGLLLLGALAAPSASARTTWLCQPSNASDPCHRGLTSTAVSPTGKVGAVEHASAAKSPKIDCFYVYPTVSEEARPQADFKKTTSVKDVAYFQTARFRQDCRVWAPVYRQITLQGLLPPQTVSPAMMDRAYADVRAAWRDYLAHDNHGRGVVLISHSQGTWMLRRLITGEIDPRKSERKRLVSGLLLGGNVTVAKGKDVGGDFKHVRACRSSTQTGCVIAYSTYDQTPPPNTIFGGSTLGDAFWGITPRPGREVLCTNPAALGGGSAKLDGYIPTTSFPGVLGAEAQLETGPLPKVSTPWIHIRDGYTAHCSAAGGAHVLRVAEVPGGRHLNPEPDATWGLHLSDAFIAQGSLVKLVARQATAYLKKNG
jgi:Protein of unknown function (DUF3089)